MSGARAVLLAVPGVAAAVSSEHCAALCREFFGQGWMKLEKNERTPYIMKNTKHFNDVSGAAGWDKKNGARRVGAG